MKWERWGGVAAVCAAAGALGLWVVLFPTYFFSQGLPLDDAWIHLVYGRAVAHQGMLAYNPGIPATGATSPLWAVLLAIPHWVGGDVASVVLADKLQGGAFHVLAVWLGWLWLRRLGASPAVAAASAAVLAVHPDSVAASVSGMEVSVTVAAILGTFALSEGRRVWPAAVCAAAAYAARPESAVIIGIYVVVRDWYEGAGTDRRSVRAWRRTLASGAGGGLMAALLAARNWTVSGRPLPATFYAKVSGEYSLWDRLGIAVKGVGDYLGEIAVLDATAAVAVVVLVGAWWMRRRRPEARLVPAAWAGVAAVFVASFLMPFFFPGVFYHQRYVLPGAALLVLVVPWGVWALVERLCPGRWRRAAVLVACAAVLLSVGWDTPLRAARLAADARNIDDLQVAQGRFLASRGGRPTVWVVDAGAVRYVSDGFAVDLMGLNTWELLDPGAADAFLRRHPADYVQIVTSVNEVFGLDRNGVRTFRARSEFTVTGVRDMAVHHLVPCVPASGAAPVVRVGKKTFRVYCRGAAASAIEGR